MKIIQKLVHFVVQTVLATTLSSAGFSQPSPSECKEIAIDSAGPIRFNSTAIKAIAPHEIDGLALFVLVRPPTRLKITDDILRIAVWADIVSRPKPLCRRALDLLDKKEEINCSLSLQGEPLQIVVQYKMLDSGTFDGRYEDRTRIIADYVAEEVLCGARKEDPRTHL